MIEYVQTQQGKFDTNPKSGRRYLSRFNRDGVFRIANIGDVEPGGELAWARADTILTNLDLSVPSFEKWLGRTTGVTHAVARVDETISHEIHPAVMSNAARMVVE